MALNEKVRKELTDLLVDVIKDHAFGDGQDEEMIRHGHKFVGLETLRDDDFIAECEADGVLDQFVDDRRAEHVRVGDHVETGVGWLEVTDLAVGGGEVTLIADIPGLKRFFGRVESWQVTVPKGMRVRTLRMEV